MAKRTLPAALKAHQFKKGHTKARIGEQHGPVDDMAPAMDGPDAVDLPTPADSAPVSMSPEPAAPRPAAPRAPRMPAHHAQHGQMRVMGGKCG